MVDVALRKLHQMLREAANRSGKLPRLVLMTPEGTRVAVYVSSKGATSPDSVTVVEHAAREFQRFGFVLPDGSWETDRKWNGGTIDVLPTLRLFVADPTNVATAQGAKTGLCTFCGLTNRQRPPFFHVECARYFGLGDL